MSARRKPRVVAAPVPAVPEWLTRYEERARAAGFVVERHRFLNSSESDDAWWLSIEMASRQSPAFEARLALFGADRFVLDTKLQDRDPRQMQALAGIAYELIAHVAPEIIEHFA